MTRPRGVRGDGARSAPSWAYRRRSRLLVSIPRPVIVAPPSMIAIPSLIVIPAKAGTYPSSSFLRRQESIRRESAADGAAPRLHVLPGATSFLRKREPTPHRHSCVGRNPFGAKAPQTGLRPVSTFSPVPRHSRESGNLPLIVIPAKAGTYPSSSFLRRQESIRRESATDGAAPRLHVLPGATSFPRKREPTPHRHSCIGRNPFGAIAPQTGLRPVSTFSPAPRHSRESGNLPLIVIPA